jgi:hypothetical protein
MESASLTLIPCTARVNNAASGIREVCGGHGEVTKCKVNMELSLCLIKHRAIKMYGGHEVECPYLHNPCIT